MNAQELSALLQTHGIRPLKARGQHFLLDSSVVEDMVEAANVQPGDAVVEIGPGPGVLTEVLVARGARVVAIELDTKLADLIESRFDKEQVTLIRGDARRVTNGQIFSAFGGATAYKLVANLPYGITSETFVKFLRRDPRPVSVTLMVQREVADRVTASPPDMSAIAVTVQTLSVVHKIRNVPAGSFFPPPKVDSAVIHMTLPEDVRRDERMEEAILKLAHTAFLHRRRQIRNTLRPLFTEDVLEKALIEAKMDASARPERVSVEEWRRLAQVLTT